MITVNLDMYAIHKYYRIIGLQTVFKSVINMSTIHSSIRMMLNFE